MLKKIPIPICGLMLGLASLGNLVESNSLQFKYLLGILSFAIFILISLKIIFHFDMIKEELKNPIPASVFPTYFMGAMVLTTYSAKFSPKPSFYLWSLFIIFHFIYLIGFSIKVLFNKFSYNKILPSFFVVYVGIVVASLTSPAFKSIFLGQLIFKIGLLFYLILLPFVLYKVLVKKDLPKPALPTITIVAAPASLCLAGYLSAFEVKSASFVYFLFSLALIMLLGVMSYMPQMLKTPFNFTYSAFTFPIVISSIAMKKSCVFFQAQNSDFINYILIFSNAMQIIAIFFVCFVFATYFKAIALKKDIG